MMPALARREAVIAFASAASVYLRHAAPSARRCTSASDNMPRRAPPRAAATRRSKRARIANPRVAPASPPSSPDRCEAEDEEYVAPPSPDHDDADDADFAPETPPRRRTSRAERTPSRGKREAGDKKLADGPAPDSQPRAFADGIMPAFRTALLDWYVANHRELPWRAPPRHRVDGPPAPFAPAAHPAAPGGAYAVWVSEIMSQQTRLDVVVAYFKRWMQAFPSVADLAAAPRDRVNELWAGLGYYRRARFLHEAAAELVASHDGALPGELDGLRRVRGVGRYTAGAVASIAFDARAACVDGNVERVLARVLPGLSVDGADRVARSDDVWHVAERLVAECDTPGDLNQALMELGATVCAPRAPKCDTCPVARMCGALAEARLADAEPAHYVTRYPQKRAKKPVKVRDEAVVALVACVAPGEDGAGGMRFLVTQRPGNGLLAGLWEAPNVVVGSSLADASPKHVATLVEAVRATVPSSAAAPCIEADVREAGRLTHIFSHIRQQLRVVVLPVRAPGFVPPSEEETECTTADGVAFRWLTAKELKQAAVSTQMRKVFALASSHI